VTDAQGAPLPACRLGIVPPIDPAAWHRIRIVALGDHVVHEVDGIVAVDFTDRHPQRLRRGVLALQLHGGAPMTVRFRNLLLRELAGTAPPQWIWAAAVRDEQEVWLQRTFVLGERVTQGKLHATCDNRMTVWLNGVEVMRGEDWARPQHRDVAHALREGQNELLVRARNDDGPAGMALDLGWTGASRQGSLRSGPDWLVSEREPRAEGAGWQIARGLGEIGQPGLRWSADVGADALRDVEIQARPGPAPELALLPGFVAERILEVPRSLGSWVCLAFDPRGRLYASDQRRGLWRITPAQGGDARVEPVPVDLEGAQGLLWAFDSLYAIVNGKRSGLYRLRDRDGDDRLDEAVCLTRLENDGEHGPHGLVLAPEGEGFLVTGGNHTPLPRITGSRVPTTWDEDQLVRQIEDPRGHANGIRAPGGWVCRVSPDGSRWEVVAIGLRNAYDLALDPDGELFTFDSDMEWDVGLPWYRPTRILHVTSGAEFGWRTGSGKWPATYPDSLPGILDLGLGSPTGLVFGAGTTFPARYRDALFALDWTNGVIHAIHLERAGASWRATREEFVRGKPLALTDAVVGKDGALWFVTGGRGTKSVLYRVWHPGEAAAPAAPRGLPPAVQQRRRLEAFHGCVDPAAVEAAWPALGSEDLHLRYAARLALEFQPVAQWRQAALAETDAARRATALLALARCGTPDDRGPILASLLRLPWEAHAPRFRIEWLRTLGLVLIRLGPASAFERERLLATLEPRFPTGEPGVDRELSMLLVHLESKVLVPRLVSRLQFGPDDPQGLASAIHAAFLLRLVRGGWTPQTRQQLFEFFPRAAAVPGGESYVGYLRAIRRDALEQLDQGEREALGRLPLLRLTQPPEFPITPPRGPGRVWTLPGAIAVLQASPQGLRGRSFESGRNLYHATGCAVCHRIAGDGGDIGPDLTRAGNKFAIADLLAAILEPNRDISDQYGTSVVRLKDGTSRLGRVVRRPAKKLLEVHAPDPDVDPETIRDDDVAAVESVKTSQMPAGLLDRLNQDELLDLLAYVSAGGDRKSPPYRGER
jgi:putative heme-binding domain-containing protein